MFDYHTWAGCKCTLCGKLRDQDHQWVGGKCETCHHACNHNILGCKCTVCGLSVDAGHLWEPSEFLNSDKITCALCGNTIVPPDSLRALMKLLSQTTDKCADGCLYSESLHYLLQETCKVVPKPEVMLLLIKHLGNRPLRYYAANALRTLGEPKWSDSMGRTPHPLLRQAAAGFYYSSDQEALAQYAQDMLQIAVLNDPRWIFATRLWGKIGNLLPVYDRSGGFDEPRLKNLMRLVILSAGDSNIHLARVWARPWAP